MIHGTASQLADALRIRPLPRWPYRLGLALSLVYYVAAGVLGLASPAANGVDFSVCYVAGVTTRGGASPYNFADLTSTRSTLNPTLAAKPSYPFAYPPSVIPGCGLVSLLPWDIAQALWKLLNTVFLVGSVLLTFRLFSDLHFRQEDRYLAWSFAFIFSPTVTVLLVGQSSLFVLFTTLLTAVLCKLRKSWAAGLSLALALTKPHLTLPFVLLLLFRRRVKITIVALATFAALAMLGLYLSDSSLYVLLQGLRRYAEWNSPTNPRLVGIQNLTTRVLGLSYPLTTLLSLAGGFLLLGVTFRIERKLSLTRGSEEVFPLLFLVSVFAFGAHSYDLVFLIPMCIWALGRWRRDGRYLPVVLLCFILVIPLNAITIAYEKLLSRGLPSIVFQVVVEPYRSWILLILLVWTVNLTRKDRTVTT